MIENVKTFSFGLLFIIAKIISKAMINNQAEIGPTWRAPLSKLKYDVVLPPLITQDSWLVNNILIQSIKWLPKLTLLKPPGKIHD